ncbi:carboxypeptidase regulatory-like domain-containing protein [Kordia sp. YSTF-M3]|uniref:Carboxypeptidase regulatory-like domain-containing protein n=1 Tax=Kordia aestuariivivens TaxID=2759037 RepID=A0ABR7QGG9_9FLAO|nr:carboxypeptidase-like regulatory domain-containing protein [Kordia aestuariivivens]MBC8757670.1 carboxypeptidase regulatory-like domain-containing protein [Kordia aestuariivivens]
MKIQKLILILLAISFFTSCEKDSESAPLAESSVSGKFLAPNDLDPIVNGIITASKDGTIVSETISGIDGSFTLTNLQAGTYELALQKGLFSSARTVEVAEDDDITLPNIPIEVFPRIGVVTGSYDNIESVLYDIGLVNPFTQEPLFDIIQGTGLLRPSGNAGHHGHNHGNDPGIFLPENSTNLQPNVAYTFADLVASPTLLAQYDILFLNCGLNEGYTEFNGNIFDYVNNGGILYATDWAFKYVEGITGNGQQYIDFLDEEKSGQSVSTNATIFDPNLIAWLQVNFNITIDNNDTVLLDEFLPAWQVVDSANDATVISWFNGPVTYRDVAGTEITENKDLAFTFIVGNGGVFYSSFHTENHDDGFSTVDRLLEYLVFELSSL